MQHGWKQQELDAFLYLTTPTKAPFNFYYKGLMDFSFPVEGPIYIKILTKSKGKGQLW